MMQENRRRCVLAAVICGSLLTSHVRGDDAARRRFETEAPSAWAQLQRATKRCSVTAIQDWQVWNDDTIVNEQQRTYTYKSRENQFLAERGLNQVKGPTQRAESIMCWVWGDSCHFFVSRADMAASWVLEYVNTRGDDPDFQQELRNFSGGMWDISFALLARPLGEVFGDSQCRVLDVSHVPDVDGAVAVDFELPLGNDEYPVRGGRIVLNPGSLWRIESYELQLIHDSGKGYRGLGKGSIQYADEQPEGLPIPMRKEFVETFPDKPGLKAFQRYSYSEYAYADPPESTFKLTAFDIPESVAGEPPRSKRDAATPQYVQRQVVPIGTVALGEEHEAQFRFHNPTHRPLRIVGAETFCGVHGCSSATGLPVEVPPTGEQTVNVKCKASATGAFEIPLIFFTDDPRVPRISCAITGVGEGEEAGQKGRQ